MRVRLRVREVAEQKGIVHIKVLAERASLAYDTASDLWHSRMQRIDRDVLARVCAALECTTGDVLVYEATNNGKNSEENRVPLLAISV